MSRRRKLSRPRLDVIGKAVPWDYRIQALEQRLLFTTFTAGPGEVGEYEYEAEGGGVMRIDYRDVTFEAIGVAVDTKTDAITVGNLVPAGLKAPVYPALAFNLFTIYVTQSAADSYIIVSPVARETNPPANGIRADQPFGGGQTLLIDPDDGTVPYALVPGGAIGSGVLGAFSAGLTNGSIKADIPIIAVTDPGPLGLYPGNAFGDGLLHAGLDVPDNATTGAPQSLNTFKFAGEIFGNVAISGNIQMFYAGAILTGGEIAPDDENLPGTDNGEGFSLQGGAQGAALPDIPTSASTVGNFTVGGDLQELITAGDVGGAPGTASLTGLANYDTGFTATIGGKLGQVKELNGGFYGTINVAHSPAVTGFTDTTPQQEIEYKNTGTFIVGDPGGIGQIFADDTGYLDNLLPDQLPPPFGNDTPDAAQFLSTQQTVDAYGNILLNKEGLPIYDAEVEGTLQNAAPISAKNGDAADWYAVSLEAGKTFTISVALTAEVIAGETSVETTAELTDDILLKVQDPDGRMIASSATITNGVLQITTDRPGIYRIGLSPNGSGLQEEDISYLLKVAGLGDLGFGMLTSGADVSDLELDSFITVQNGDFGGIIAADSIISATLGPTESDDVSAPLYSPSSIVVLNGDLRTVIANSIGTFKAGSAGTVAGQGAVAGAFGDELILSIPRGGVGLIRSTGVAATTGLALETQFDPNYDELKGIFKTNDTYATAIGGPIQDIDSGSTLFADIATNQGIGAIHAATMDTDDPSYIDVNADNSGFDGIIDLIDVSGQFGVLGAGPEIVTNDGGNVRYMNVGGPIFLPTVFGGLEDFPITYAPGVSQTLTDDSGTEYTITANGPVTTTAVNSSSGVTSAVTTGPQFTTLTYPVLDKAGLIPISISSTGSLTVTAAGTNKSVSSLDIGSISITGEGRQIITGSAQLSTGVITTTTDAYGNTSIIQPVPTGGETGVEVGPTTDATDDFLSLTGPATINVLNVQATVNTVLYPLNSPVEISNSTQGEVVNITAPQGIGSIVVNGNLGFGEGKATPMPIMPKSTIADGNTYPFVQQHTGVVIGTGFVISDAEPVSSGTTGDVVSIQVGGAAGNIEAGGTIQSLITDYAGKPLTGQINGVVGPVLATRLLYVNVGQGLSPTGTGLVGFAGLYGTGKIGTVVSSGGDIRGNIVSAEDDATNIGIDAITVTNGSIIGSIIATISDSTTHAPQFTETSPLYNAGGGYVEVKGNGENFAPGEAPYVYDVGPITVSGDGGIIGTLVETVSVSSVTVTGGGFGILESSVEGQSTGRLGSVSASGYGIRDSTFEAFGYIGAVTATGNGSLIPVTRYGLDVRPSDVPGMLDPFFGVIPNADIDLNAVLGTTAATPNIANVTDTGVIQDDTFSGSRDLTSLTAQKARTALPLFTPETLPLPELLNIPILGETFLNSVSFGGMVGSINIKQVVDGFQITAGQLGKLLLGESVNRFGISVAGNLNSLTIHGNLGQYITDPNTGNLIPDSYINAGGINGTITALRIIGNLNANISATGSIGSILVTGYVLGSITSYANTGGLALGSLRVLGGLRNGALTLKGNVGSIIVNGGLGTSTGTLDITGSANLIEVGANKVSSANALALALTVEGTLKKLLVYGKITGSVHTLGDLTNLTVIGAGSSIITAPIQVDGRIGTATITHGDIASNITAVGSIGNFTINRGSVLFGSTVESDIDAIRNFKITGGANYGMFGSLLAPSGLNDNIDISGNIGDGIDPAIITADSGNIFHIRGTIDNLSTVTVTGAINLLQVDNGIQSGATITALQIKKRRLSGTNNGSIVTTLP